jgi:hypothetical protein
MPDKNTSHLEDKQREEITHSENRSYGTQTERGERTPYVPSTESANDSDE